MKKNKNAIILISVFLFFLVIGILIPYTGDDWNNLIGHNGNLNIMISSAVASFNDFEGRFFSRIFDFIFNYYRPLWILINALGMTFLYYFMCKMVSSKKSFIFLLIIEAILLIDKETFSQIYAWITGNTTYFIPFLFMIFLIYINRDIFLNIQSKDLNIVLKILLPFLSFIFSMFVENVSVGIIVTCLLIIIYRYIKDKKFDWVMIITMLTSAIGLIIMLNSPGTKNRINDMDGFSNLNLFSKLLITIPRQFNYVFVKNSFLIIMLIFIIDYYIIKNFKSLKRIFLLMFMNLIPIMTLTLNIYYNIVGHGIRYIYVFLDCSNFYVFLYWLLFLIIYLYLIIKFNKNNNMKLLFFFILAVTNHMAMLISPLAGGRTSFLSTIMLYICAIILIDNLPIKWLDSKLFIRINIIICVIISIFFLWRYSFYHWLDKKREAYIKKQLEDGNETIEVIILPEFYLWNANPWNDWHWYTFKQYYHIPEDKKVELVQYSFEEIKKL